MSTLSYAAIHALIAVAAASASLFTLRAAGVPFPAELSPAAWAHWAVLAALVHTCHTLLLSSRERVTGPQAPRSKSGPPTAVA